MPNLLDTIRSDPNYNPQRSYWWFQRKVRELVGNQPVAPQKMMAQSKALMVSNILPGHMYTFVYDPKLKDKLPYYDAFPLVLPFNKDSDSFIGLNLHYLPYQMRLLLLNKLMHYAVHNKRGDVAYLQFSWAMLKAASNLPEVKPCVKRYLNNHVRSKFIAIPSEDWATATMLPTENFKKAPLKEVWRQSSAIAKR